MDQPPLLPSYQKPWKSYAEQVCLLRSRGLIVGDTRAAVQFLSHVNYYRLSGYCLAFEQDRHQFLPGVTFEQIRNAYEFDRVLRDLITEALEVVEVDFRTVVAYHFGRAYGAFGHTLAGSFFRNFDQVVWLDKVHDETERSSELFVEHFRTTYREYPDLPIWAVAEILSFGGLSKMYSGMISKDQKAIACRYRIQPGDLESWLHHLVYVRNLCAHHSRVWDRIWSIKPRLPSAALWHPPYTPCNDRLFSTLLMLNQLMGRCSSVADFADEWRARIVRHLGNSPAAPDSLKKMGLTAQWHAHPFWHQ